MITFVIHFLVILYICFQLSRNKYIYIKITHFHNKELYIFSIVGSANILYKILLSVWIRLSSGNGEKYIHHFSMVGSAHILFKILLSVMFGSAFSAKMEINISTISTCMLALPIFYIKSSFHLCLDPPFQRRRK